MANSTEGGRGSGFSFADVHDDKGIDVGVNPLAAAKKTMRVPPAAPPKAAPAPPVAEVAPLSGEPPTSSAEPPTPPVRKSVKPPPRAPITPTSPEASAAASVVAPVTPPVPHGTYPAPPTAPPPPAAPPSAEKTRDAEDPPRPQPPAMAPTYPSSPIDHPTSVPSADPPPPADDADQADSAPVPAPAAPAPAPVYIPVHVPTAQELAKEAAKNLGKTISLEAAGLISTKNAQRVAGQNTHDAAERGDETQLTKLLADWKGRKEIIDWLDSVSHSTPLLAASRGGHVACLQMLLADAVVDVGHTDAQKRTALMHACHAGQLECIQLLLSHAEVVASTGARDAEDHNALGLYLASPNPQASVILSLLALDLPFGPGGEARASQYSWSKVLDRAVLVSEAVSLEVAQAVLHDPAHKRVSARAWAMCRDAAGRTALSTCHPRVRELFESEMFFCGRYDLSSSLDGVVQAGETAVLLLARDRGQERDYRRQFQSACAGGQGAELSFTGFCSLLEAEAGADEIDPPPPDEPDSNGRPLTSLEKAERVVNAAKALEAARREVFSKWARAAPSKGMTEAEFVAYCVATRGRGQTERRVAIKFMRRSQECQRERSVRSACALSPSHVVGLLPLSAEHHFALEVKVRGGLVAPDGRSLARFTQGLVLEPTDTTLETVVRAERPSLRRARSLLRPVVEALGHCHSRGCVHGLLTAANVHRVEGSWRLANFTGAASVGTGHLGAEDCFASACLPPEMFHLLQPGDAALLEAYWSPLQEDSEDVDINAALLERLQPRYTQTGSAAVVKAFRVQADGSHVSEGLPYSLVAASAAADAWALGLLLLSVCTGEPLLPCDRNHDLNQAQDLLQACSWTDSDLDARIDGMRTPHGDEDLSLLLADLLRRLLRRQPAERLQSMAAVLSHAFFTDNDNDGGGDDENTRASRAALIEAGRARRAAQADEDGARRSALRNTLVLPALSSRALVKLNRAGRVLAASGSQWSWSPQCCVVLSLPLPPRGEERQMKERVLREDAAERLQFLCSLLQSPTPLELAKRECSPGRCVYLYMVDEASMQPVVPQACAHKREKKAAPGHCLECAYPLRLDDAAALVALLPLVRLTFKAAGLPGVASLVGFPSSSAALTAESRALVERCLGQGDADGASGAAVGAEAHEAAARALARSSRGEYGGLVRVSTGVGIGGARVFWSAPETARALQHEEDEGQDKGGDEEEGSEEGPEVEDKRPRSTLGHIAKRLSISVGWGWGKDKDGKDGKEKESFAAQHHAPPPASPATKESVDAEDELPPGWKRTWSDAKNKYFYTNLETKEKSWKAPQPQSPAPAPAPSPSSAAGGRAERESPSARARASPAAGAATPAASASERDEDELPPGWKRTWSEEKSKYFYTNLETREKSWRLPAQGEGRDERREERREGKEAKASKKEKKEKKERREK